MLPDPTPGGAGSIFRRLGDTAGLGAMVGSWGCTSPAWGLWADMINFLRIFFL